MLLYKTEYFIYCNTITRWWNTWILNISKGNRQDDMIVSLSIIRPQLHFFTTTAVQCHQSALPLCTSCLSWNLIKHTTEKCLFFKISKNIPHLDAKGLKFTAQILCMLHHSKAYFHIILVGGSSSLEYIPLLD